MVGQHDSGEERSLKMQMQKERERRPLVANREGFLVAPNVKVFDASQYKSKKDNVAKQDNLI